MKKDAPCLLLYNPISSHGHLDSWTALFVTILLRAGWRVNVATPNAEDLFSRLRSHPDLTMSNLHVLDWNTPRYSLFQRILRRLQKIVSPQHIQIEQAVDPRYLDPYDMGLRLASFKSLCRWKPSIVLNMYMDMYSLDKNRWSLFESVNPLPWLGIRFVPGETGSEAYYELPSLAGMCFLNEAVSQRYQSLLPSLSFCYLPDITDNTLPPIRTSLAKQIKDLAKERKIVFLGGTLGGNKNLASWYQLIRISDPDQWYFVQIGEMFEDTLSAEDAVELAKINSQCPENLFIKREYLPDEADFNEVIALSDVIFAVYRNFSISSNMPGKAAAFEKPILVAEGYLMGERVLRYGIGLAVPEDDVSKMYSGLQLLFANKAPLKENFRAYREDFSPAALGKELTRCLDDCLSKRDKLIQ